MGNADNAIVPSIKRTHALTCLISIVNGVPKPILQSIRLSTSGSSTVFNEHEVVHISHEP